MKARFFGNGDGGALAEAREKVPGQFKGILRGGNHEVKSLINGGGSARSARASCLLNPGPLSCFLDCPGGIEAGEVGAKLG